LPVIILLAFFVFFLMLIYDIYKNRNVRFRIVSLVPEKTGLLSEKSTLSLLHLSDMHLRGSSAFIVQALERLRERKWDFIFMTGDLIDSDSGIKPAAEALVGLKASSGKYAVLGNHDYLQFKPENILQWFQILFGTPFKNHNPKLCRENNIDALISALGEKEVCVLRNQCVSGEMADGTRYQIFGIDDPSTDRDVPASLYNQVDDEALHIVLMHSPQRLSALRPLKPDLVLCGHTHGGQIRIPFWGALTTASDAKRKASSGIVFMDGFRVHISPGMGAGHIFPFRILVPPELTEIIIEKKPANAGLLKK
jgi:predicted MPP superfamily phosphohydrolase